MTGSLVSEETPWTRWASGGGDWWCPPLGLAGRARGAKCVRQRACGCPRMQGEGSRWGGVGCA